MLIGAYVAHMGWSFVHACSAIADLSVRPFLHTSRCSFSLVPSLRLVSPMYTWPQVQGTSYTMFAYFSMGRGCFTFVRRPRRVGLDLNTVLMLKS